MFVFSHKTQGVALGFIGITCFSLTMPLTKFALDSFHPLFISFGRVALAGLVAVFICYFRGTLPLLRKYFKQALGVSLGVGLGFPLFTSLALAQTESSHAGIVLAILPLCTAIAGAIIHKEKYRWQFWVAAVMGGLTVFVYVMYKFNLELQLADIYLLLAVISASFAYASGAKLSKSISGIDVICFAVIIMLPVSIPVSIVVSYFYPAHDITLGTFSAFLYVAIISQLVGFFPWYKGLALGGVGVVSQVQLLQVFLTLIESAILLGERVTYDSYLVAGLIVLQIVIAKKYVS
jgi:drug/metabolite transporter (DMT)-like permease